MRRYWWVVVLVGVRLWLALTFPVFNDEAIYAWWSQLVADYGKQGLVPMLMDGKQPGMLLVWSVAEKIMGEWQPFLALRLASVGLSIVTAVLAFDLFTKIGGKKIKWWQRLVFVLTPGLVWYESLGLQEAAVMLWTMMLVWVMVRYERGEFDKQGEVRLGVMMGLAIGSGWWIKPTALVALPGLVYVGLRRFRGKMVGMAVVTAGLVILSMQLLPEAEMFWRASQARLGELPSFWRLVANLEWMVWWVGIVAVVGLRWLVKHKRWSLLMVVVSGLVLPLWVGRGIYASRYVAGMFPILALVGVMAMDKRWSWLQLVWSVVIVGGLIVKPLEVYEMSGILPAVKADLSQYLVNWTSGWGVKEATNYVKTLPTDKVKIVLVRLDAGNPESAVLASLWHNKRIIGTTEMALDGMKRVLEQQVGEVYFISRDGHLGSISPSQVELLATFERPMNSGYVGVWRIVN